MEKPRFVKTGETDGGYPIYERTRESRSEQSEASRSNESDPTEPKLSKQQRQSLKLALAFVGAMFPTELNKQTDDTSMPDRPPIESVESDPDEVVDQTVAEEDGTKDNEVTTRSTENASERIESVPESEVYNRYLEGYEAQYTLAYNEVQYLDETHAPVGDPVLIEDLIGPPPPGVTMPPEQKPEYRYTPGPTDELGIPREGISPQWLDYVQSLIEERVGNTQSIAERVHAVTAFRAVLDDPELADLHERIAAGEVRRYDQLINYFIDQPFEGANGMDRYEFARTHIAFRDTDKVVETDTGEVTFRAVPAVVEKRLRSWIPGLLANESMFRDDLRSSADAQGAGQILPSVWEQYTGEETVSTEYSEQIEVMGQILSDMYDRVLDQIGESQLALLREHIGDEDHLQGELIARLTLNSYNAGPDRVAEVVRAYLESTPAEEWPQNGADLFLAITTFGAAATTESHGGEYISGYGPYASQYVQKSESAANILTLQREDEGGD